MEKRGGESDRARDTDINLNGFEQTPNPLDTLWLGFINTPEFSEHKENYELWKKATEKAIIGPEQESLSQEERKWLIYESDIYEDTPEMSWFTNAAYGQHGTLPGEVNRAVRFYLYYKSQVD